MKRWQGSCISALLVLLIGGGALIFIVPVGGAMITATPLLFDRLTVYAVCPEAIDHSFNEYGSAPIDSTNPSGGTGHYRDLTCTYEDGSQKTFLNDEVALKGLGAAFSLAGVSGGALLLLLMGIAALIGGRLVKPKT
jgi:hypothetical protein